MELRGKRVVVTGGSGFLGRHVVEQLRKAGVVEVIVPRKRDMDLRLMEHCLALTKGEDLVIHLAAHVGGIGLNQEKPGELFYDNAIMGIQLIEACRLNHVKKVVVAGTICAYPKFAAVPFKEADLWSGYPEETNAPYGIAKKALLVQMQSYRRQYGLNGIYLLPVNLYGPHDNFDPKASHVIPALIRKVQDAINAKADHIVVWGDGSATREFLYVEDAADAIVKAVKLYEGEEPVNIGSGYEISIRDLVGKIVALMEFKGEIVWDADRPNGQPRRMLDTSRAHNWFGFTAQTKLEEGLARTIAWYRQGHFN